MQIGKYKTTSEAVSGIWNSKGFVKGFYAGFGPFVLRDIPFSAIQFPLYEVLKMTSIKVLAARSGLSESTYELPGFVNSINGSIAGATSGFLTTPLDVLKTRRMTFQNDSKKRKKKQITIGEEINMIVKEEGVQGLFRGAKMRMLYLTIGGFAFFGVYENSKRIIASTLGI